MELYNGFSADSNCHTQVKQDLISIIFLDSTKLKIVWIKITTFLNDTFQSCYDLFQVN